MTVKRGTSNSNQRGSAESRRRRREWLLDTYRANVDIWTIKVPHVGSEYVIEIPAGSEWTGFEHYDEWPLWLLNATPNFKKVCRCYRCGDFLTIETITVDRILPGCLGGTYRRNNIRPACGDCNSETGGALAHRNRKAA